MVMATEWTWGHIDGVPGGQTWSNCQYCRLSTTSFSSTPSAAAAAAATEAIRRQRGFEIHLFDPSGQLASSYINASTSNTTVKGEEGERGLPLVVLSRSRWHGFFHHATEEVKDDFIYMTHCLALIYLKK